MAHRLLLRCAGVALVAVLGGCASSHPGSGSGVEASFVRAAETWDVNRDGSVTCAEWRDYAGSIYKSADKAGKGTLSREEFAAVPQQDRLFVAANFDYFDGDRNGQVTRAEFVDKPNPAFSILDKNRSCTLTAAQFRIPEAKASAAPTIPESMPSGR